MHISEQMAGQRVKVFFTDHQKTTNSLNCFYTSHNIIYLNKEFSRHVIVTKYVVGISKTSSEFPFMFW